MVIRKISLVAVPEGLAFADRCKNFVKFFAFWKKRCIFAVQFRTVEAKKADGIEIIGVWRSWLAHLVWDQRVLCSSHSTPTKRRRQIDLPPSLFYISLTSSRFFGVYLQVEADCGEAVRIGSYFFI